MPPGEMAGGYTQQYQQSQKLIADGQRQWKNQQQVLIGNALKSLVPANNFTSINGCKCDRARALAEAQEIADALVNAVYNKRRAQGDQCAGVWGNIWHNITSTSYCCGDWQQLMIEAYNVVQAAHLAKKEGMCFRGVQVSASMLNNTK